MSLIADIRAQMALESGPVHPKHLAEVLDQDLATIRNTMNQASSKGHGIERLDDGTFSLIPNWTPSRGPNAGVEPAPTPSPKPPRKSKKAAPAKTPRKAKASKAKADKPKRTYTRRAAPAAKKPKAAPLRLVVTLGDECTVQVSRSSLKALVSAVLAGEQEITPELRIALREAAHQTATA
jgi:hypothetical protein